MSIIIGLTGPTGSGKSTASRAAAEYGFKWVDCDILARRAVEKGTPGLEALVRAFGGGILCADGSLDRKKLAAAAFKDKSGTELLNQTVLPFVAELVKLECKGGNVLLDAPTLFESGIAPLCTKTVAVLADREIRLKRITARDGITADEAELRISAGKGDGFYLHKADYILYNNNGEEEFLTQFNKIMTEITGGNLYAGNKISG